MCRILNDPLNTRQTLLDMEEVLVVSKNIRRRRKPVRFLTKQQVAKKVQLSIATIRNKMARKEFPAPRCTGPSPTDPVMWLEHEIDDWMLGLPPRTNYKDMFPRKAA